MATTLEKQIEAQFGELLDEDNTPSYAQAALWLIDGQYDTIQKTLKGDPTKVSHFTVQASQDSAVGSSFTGVKLNIEHGIFSAVYTPDKAGDPIRYTEMRPMSYAAAISASGSTTSLLQPTPYSPAYYINGGKAYALPDAEAGKTASVVFEIVGINDTVDATNLLTLETVGGDDGLFPKDVSHIAILYTVCKCILFKLNIISEGLQPLTGEPVIPAIPVLDIFNSTLPQPVSFGSFVSPSLDLQLDVDITSITVPTFIGVTPPSNPDFSNLGDLAITGVDMPVYTGPITSPDFAGAEVLLDDEDVELVDAKVKIISGQLNNYKLDIDSANARFNEDMARYKAQITKETQNSQTELAREVKEYEGVLKRYQTEVGANIQRYEKELTSYAQQCTIKIKEYGSLSGVDFKEFESKLQAEIGKHKTELGLRQMEFQAELANYKNELSATLTKNKDALAKYTVEIQAYGTEYQLFLKQHQMEIQKRQLEYTWLQGRYQALMGEYIGNFKIRPPQQPQQQRRS